MRTMSHLIENIKTRHRNYKNEPNRNSGVQKYKTEAKYSLEGQNRTFEQAEEKSVNWRRDRFRSISLRRNI